MKKDINKLKYVILPGKFPENPELHDIHNRAFLFFNNFWNKIFRDNGSKDKVNPDNFWRQDMVTLLLDKNQIVGQHLYSFFDLRSLAAKNHSYFIEGFTDEYIAELIRANKGNTMMSVESLAISPHWRKKDCGVSLGTVLIGMAAQQQRYRGIDILTAPCRIDVKVDRMYAEHGGEVIIPNLDMHNTPVHLMAIYKDKNKIHHDKDVKTLIDRLWNERIDLTNIPIPTERKKKIAA